jgi:hypothetical protein
MRLVIVCVCVCVCACAMTDYTHVQMRVTQVVIYIITVVVISNLHEHANLTFLRSLSLLCTFSSIDLGQTRVYVCLSKDFKRTSFRECIFFHVFINRRYNITKVSSFAEIQTHKNSVFSMDVNKCAK